MNYEDIYNNLVNDLLENNCSKTAEVTKEIKASFTKQFDGKNKMKVICSGTRSEYLLDILITNFAPNEIVTSDRKSITTHLADAEVYIAVESELGGSGGGSQKELQANIVQDFIKLLLVRSKYKIMIFSSFPYRKEEDHLTKRVDNLIDIYKHNNPCVNGILLIHIAGQKKKNQVSVTPLTTDSFSAFIISKDVNHNKLELQLNKTTQRT